MSYYYIIIYKLGFGQLTHSILVNSFNKNEKLTVINSFVFNM